MDNYDACTREELINKIKKLETALFVVKRKLLHAEHSLRETEDENLLIKNAIGGNASTIMERIGDVGTSGSLFNMIGVTSSGDVAGAIGGNNSETSLALILNENNGMCLYDTVCGISSDLGGPESGIRQNIFHVQGIINASAVVNPGFWTNTTALSSASNINDQLSEFLSLFNTSNWSTPAGTISFTCNSNTPSSFSDLLSRIV